MEDQNTWKVGFTSQVEIWHGHLAMISFVAAVLIELTSGKGILYIWGLM